MKYKISTLLFFCVIAFQAKSQNYFYNNQYYANPVIFEGGISVGIMNSLTDVGGRAGRGKRGPKDLNMQVTTACAGIYVGALYNNTIGLRLEGTIGKVQSHDSLLKDVKNTAIGRYNRNLSFRSPIKEANLLLEFHPVDFFRNFDPDAVSPSFSPYIIGGVGYFHFNPQANLRGKWIDLRPLHTEGEGFAEYPASKEYSLNQVNFSYGFGLAYELGDHFNLRLEYLNRKLNTDYLDDLHGRYIDPAVFSKYLTGNDLTNALLLNRRIRPEAKPDESTQSPGSIRGNPTNKDSYFTVSFKLGYFFGRESVSSNNKRYRRSMRSPTRF
jgi:hypothetical protein